MSDSRRVEQQPAFVLHRRPFRDTSQLLDIVSRDLGKLSLVARGSRSAKSRLRGIIRPFQPLRLSWVIRSDLGTLTGAENDGAPNSLSGDALLSGYYVNELLIDFLHRHDPQPEIFDLYRQTISALSSAGNPAPCLRVFEVELLRLLGYALNLDHEATSNEPIESSAYYHYRVEHGPVRVNRNSGAMVFEGRVLQGIQDRRYDDADVLRGASQLLRSVVHHHLGGKELKSRKVLLDLHRVRMPAKDSKRPG